MERIDNPFEPYALKITHNGKETLISSERMTFGPCIVCGAEDAALLDGVCGKCDTSEGAMAFTSLAVGATLEIIDEPGS